MKKFILFASLFIIVFTLFCFKSYASSYVCQIEVYSFTKSETVETSSISVSDAANPNFTTSGYAFIRIKNLSSSTLTVGNYSLTSSAELSVGLWSSSVAGSSSGSSSANHNGVFYNLERYKFGYTENPTNAVHLIARITKDDLQNVTNKIIEKNDTYNVLTYNCSSLAVDLWNAATGDSLSAGIINTPENLRNNIIKSSNYTYSTTWPLSRSYQFYYYSTSTNSLVACV